MSILAMLITRAAVALEQFSRSLNTRSDEWVTNQSGHSSFRPEVIHDGHGFTAIIHRRTGHSSKEWTYKRCADAGRFSSFRKAMKAGRRLALELAELRYRFD